MVMKNKILSFITSCVLAIPILAHAVPTQNLWEVAALGTQPAVTQISLVGMNPVPTTTFEALWPESAAYTPLSVAMSSPYCASSDANDTSAGTGARTISVKGINTSYARFTETVTMNGQSSVTLATANILLIDSIEVLTAGSGGLNAGIIQCGTGANTLGDPAVTHAYLAAGSISVALSDGLRSNMFFYGVPAGYSLLCREWMISQSEATAASLTQVAIDTYTNGGILKRHRIAFSEAGGGNPSIVRKMILFPEKTILIGQVGGLSTNEPVLLTSDCILINNAYLDQPGGIL